MDVVVMPTLKRPEMLALALEAIDRTGSQPDIRIFLDHSDEARVEEVEYVRDQYAPDAMIFHAKPHVNVPSGMWNILNALKQGYETGAERVFLIEEDVVVKPDFFNWHRAIQNHNPNILASCGRRMKHLPDYNHYTNPGSCFSSSALSLVVKHIKSELFQDRRNYFDSTFGPMDEVSDLDDGLIRRVEKFYAMDVIYPDTPKCSHIGFRAYNHYMGWDNSGGSLRYRIARLRHMLTEVDPNYQFTRDFEPL